MRSNLYTLLFLLLDTSWLYNLPVLPRNWDFSKLSVSPKALQMFLWFCVYTLYARNSYIYIYLHTSPLALINNFVLYTVLPQQRKIYNKNNRIKMGQSPVPKALHIIIQRWLCSRDVLNQKGFAYRKYM